MLRLAAIGLGGRATEVIRLMRLIEPEVKVVAVADPDEPGARARFERFSQSPQDARYYASADLMLQYADRFDGVLIGTRCMLHTPLAAAVAAAGLPLFLEKPVSISFEQLQQLHTAWRGREDRVVVSFPLRVQPMFKAAMEIIASGRLGQITQVQAFNNVPYGHGYFAGWCRNYDESGGLWMQKATHDLDYVNVLMGSTPVMVAAASSRTAFGGDMPERLRCSECDRTADCLESPRNRVLQKVDGKDHLCLFSDSIHNHDAASAIVRYADGRHASYAQNFVTRRSAARRGAIVTGYRGTIQFNFWHEPKKQLRFIDHFSERTDLLEFPHGEGHGFGDHELCRSFVAVMRGAAPASPDLRDGLVSAATCLAARQSCQTNRFEQIPQFGPEPREIARPRIAVEPAMG